MERVTGFDTGQALDVIVARPYKMVRNAERIPLLTPLLGIRPGDVRDICQADHGRLLIEPLIILARHLDMDALQECLVMVTRISCVGPNPKIAHVVPITRTPYVIT